MMQYRYVKAHAKEQTRENQAHQSLLKKSSLLFSRALIIVGSLLIINVVWPILSYELFTAPSLKKQNFLSPVPASGQETFGPEVITDSSQLPSENDSETDLTRPQNWFPQANFPERKKSNISYYNLSIPKFDIKDAKVAIGGEDLKKNLIHYPGTALPGEIGAPVIFGHSILPQFFNPTNYLSIFSLIPTLELGDKIIIKFDGITYTYRVIDKVEVKPDNISVLEQPYDNEYLRLITCTPPGTYLRRGVITATLVD